MKRKIILLSIFIGSILVTNAQDRFEVHVGAALPTGDFKSNTSANSGSAETGFALGLKYFVPLTSVKGLSATIGVDFLNNGVNQTGRKQMDDQFKSQLLSLGVTDYSLNMFDYINVPLLVGVDYKMRIDNSFSVYGNVATGINYSKPTNFTMQFQYMGVNAKETVSFKPLIGMATQLGAGILIEHKYNIGVQYDLLGAYAYSAKETFEAGGQSQSNNTESKFELKINTLNLIVGMRF